jgi:hypothetical protein|tara:strand:- start:239 stop:412 length:174 start_codon:yes stop_codon:yes gene_type:complete
MDYYYDGPNVVFTEGFHLRRGYCCNNGCRHCPYEKTITKKIQGSSRLSAGEADTQGE